MNGRILRAAEDVTKKPPHKMVKKDQYEVFLWNGLELLVKIFTRDPLCEGISLGVKWMVQPKTDRGAIKNDRKNV